MTGRLVRAVAAGAALVALMVGVPAALAMGVGWPLPRAVPPWSQITATLGGELPLDPAVVTNVLAVVVWLAWSQLAVAVAVEAAARREHRSARRWPPLGPAQGLAAVLLAALIVQGPPAPAGARPGATVGVWPVPARAPQALVEPPAPVVPPSTGALVQQEGTSVEHVVQRRDTLWDLAERYLAPGGRHDEIAAGVAALYSANAGVAQHDGSALSDAGALRPGWVLRIPGAVAGAEGPPTGEVIGGPELHAVVHGDTLWDLAEEALGDGHRWPALFAANQGRVQADGRSLSDPDRIHPGWALSLDVGIDDEGAQTTGAAGPPPTASPPPPTAPPVEGAPDPTAAASPSGPQTSPESEPVDGEQAAEATSPTLGPDRSPTEGTPGSTPGRAWPAPPPDDDRSPSAIGLLSAGLATAGLVVLLERRRRAQQRHRRRGRRVAMPREALAQSERALRAGADLGAAALADAALRAAASATAATQMPALRWVEVGGEAVTLVLGEPAAAPPGFVSTEPGRWRATDSATQLAVRANGSLSPAPLLVPLGVGGSGAEVLLDVEAGAVLSASGDEDRISRLLAAVATSAATAPWSDAPNLVLVGLSAGVAEVASVRVAATLAEALDEAEGWAAAVGESLAAVGCADTAQARGAAIAVDSWAPLMVVSAEHPDELCAGRLRALAARPGHGVGVVCPAGPTGPIGRHVDVDADGTLRVVEIEEALTAHQLAPGDVATVAELLEVASRRDDVAPAPEGPGEALRVPQPGSGPACGSGPRSRLAALLAEVDVLVRVLGPPGAVRVTPAGDLPLAAPGQKELEGLLYLALHERPPTPEELQTALWPGGCKPRTLHNAVAAIRRQLLGQDRDGEPLLPHSAKAGGRYELSWRVSTDYGLFHELVAEAELASTRDADAAELLAQALSLVRDEPLKGDANGYDWASPHRGVVVAQIVDAADELAEMRLATDDWRGAEWAARRGLAACPSDERLYRQLALAAFDSGNIAAVRRVYQELREAVADPALGVEPEDTIHPETIVLFSELRAGRRPSAGDVHVLRAGARG